MSKVEIHKGVYGIPVGFNQSADLTGATVSIVYRKPDGSESSWPGVIQDTSFYYLLQDGDIDQTGYWTIWGKAVWTDPAKSLWCGESYIKVLDAPDI